MVRGGVGGVSAFTAACGDRASGSWYLEAAGAASAHGPAESMEAAAKDESPAAAAGVGPAAGVPQYAGAGVSGGHAGAAPYWRGTK